MPVTRLFVEGELDEELLSTIFAGSPVVERRGGKYGLQGMVVRERASTGGVGLHFLRDRDFDFKPTVAGSPGPVPILTERTRVLVGWHWFRHSIECYLLEPALAARALEIPQARVEDLIREAGTALRSYSAARWTIGQARAKLPPSRHLETTPMDSGNEFCLPADYSETASWAWLSTTTHEFIEPVTQAFGETELRNSFDENRTKFSTMSVPEILVWYSGKDVLTFVAPRLGAEPPKVLRNRLRNWVRNNSEEAVRLLPEWGELKRIVAR